MTLFKRILNRKKEKTEFIINPKYNIKNGKLIPKEKNKNDSKT